MFVYGAFVTVGFLWELNNLKNYCRTVLEVLRNLKPTCWQGHTSSQELSLPSFSLLGTVSSPRPSSAGSCIAQSLPSSPHTVVCVSHFPRLIRTAGIEFGFT